MTLAAEEETKQADMRRYRQIQANGAYVSSSAGSAPGALRQHRIRTVKNPAVTKAARHRTAVAAASAAAAEDD